MSTTLDGLDVAALQSAVDGVHRAGVPGVRAAGQVWRTGPVIALDGQTIEYGFGLHRVEVPGCGTFWGHDGTVWGAGTMSFTRADGERQLSVAINLMRWHQLDSAGKPRPHPIDDALSALKQQAMR